MQRQVFRSDWTSFKKSLVSGAPPYNAAHEAIETMHRGTDELGILDSTMKLVCAGVEYVHPTY